MQQKYISERAVVVAVAAAVVVAVAAAVVVVDSVTVMMHVLGGLEVVTAWRRKHGNDLGGNQPENSQIFLERRFAINFLLYLFLKMISKHFIVMECE